MSSPHGSLMFFFNTLSPEPPPPQLAMYSDHDMQMEVDLPEHTNEADSFSIAGSSPFTDIADCKCSGCVDSDRSGSPSPDPPHPPAPLPTKTQAQDSASDLPVSPPAPHPPAPLPAKTQAQDSDSDSEYGGDDHQEDSDSEEEDLELLPEDHITLMEAAWPTEM